MNEPAWTDIALLVVATLNLIAVAGGLVYIAYRQWRTDHLRLIHERVDRRYSIYLATSSFIDDVLAGTRLSQEAIQRFRNITYQAHFLFDDEEVISYLEDDVLQKAISFTNYGIQIDQCTDARREMLRDDRRLLVDWFEERHHHGMRDKFAPSLRP